MLITFAVAGYRSLRQLVLPLAKVNVVTGANGSGKSSLYRSIRMLADVAQGRAIGSLAREGGLPSTLWAGPEAFSREMKAGTAPVQGTSRRNNVVGLKLGFADEDFGYAIDLGMPVAVPRSHFNLDPEIKAEAIWAGPALRGSNVLAARTGPSVKVLEESGSRSHVITDLQGFDSMMTHVVDPRRTPEVLSLRERMRRWRFYDHFRTDQDAPARRAQIGTRTPVLASDGADLAAALQTLREIGDEPALDTAIEDAFPGSRVEVTVQDGLFHVTMHQHGLLRPLRAAELSDGTLRYLLLITALLTPRPPPLLVLNEPETSLHPSLLQPLARLIAKAADQAQIIVVSHARTLVDALASEDGSTVFELRKELGETIIDTPEPPLWAWPTR